MARTNRDIRLLIELHGDGQLDARDRDEVAAVLAERPDAAAYARALGEVRTAVRVPIEHEVESMRFDGLFSRIESALAVPRAESAGARPSPLRLEALVDGQVTDPAERAALETWVARDPAARGAMEAVRELRAISRLPLEREQEQADFRALQRRVDQAIDREEASREAARAAARPAVEHRGFWVLLTGFLSAHRAVFASAVTAAAVVAVMLPFLRTGADEKPAPAPTIINYYIQAPMVDEVSYGAGYWGGFQPGDGDTAPVVWIAPEEPAVPSVPAPGGANTTPDAGTAVLPELPL